MSEWIEWKGGECPVDDAAIVDVRFRDGSVWKDRPAGTLSRDWENYWEHIPSEPDDDIVAYRVVLS